MPDLIKNGFVYIAQPPLYRIKKGKTELYLKDDKELENFFIQDLIDQSVLKQKDGGSLKGKDLKNLFENVIGLNKLLENISGKNPSFYTLLEQGTISGFFDLQNFSDQKKSNETIEYILKRLNSLDNFWEAKVDEGSGIIFSKQENKVKEEFLYQVY